MENAYGMSIYVPRTDEDNKQYGKVVYIEKYLKDCNLCSFVGLPVVDSMVIINHGPSL
jgi:hypothetical protein